MDRIGLTLICVLKLMTARIAEWHKSRRKRHVAGSNPAWDKHLRNSRTLVLGLFNGYEIPWDKFLNVGVVIKNKAVLRRAFPLKVMGICVNS